MLLRPATLATFEELKSANWFARVGNNLTNSSEITVPISIAPSWADAIKQCEGDEWNLVLNESANIFRRALIKASMEEYRTWNDHVKVVKQISEPLVEKKIVTIRKEHNLPIAVADTLRWITTMTLVEAEYVHVVNSGNHAKLSYWIVNGHFPCGWKGEFPNGNLIIY